MIFECNNFIDFLRDYGKYFNVTYSKDLKTGDIINIRLVFNTKNNKIKQYKQILWGNIMENQKELKIFQK